MTAIVCIHFMFCLCGVFVVVECSLFLFSSALYESGVDDVFFYMKFQFCV